jgi:hypothetical protein
MPVVGTSLAEARELYRLLQEINGVLDQTETKVKSANRSFNQILVAATAVVGTMRRMGLGEEADAMIDKLQHILRLLLLVRTSMMVTAAAAGPLGWVIAGAGALTTIYTVDDIIGSLFGG